MWRDHQTAWAYLRGPLAWWFVPGAALTLMISALGWWGIDAISSQLADGIVSTWLGDDEGKWIQALLEWMIWLVLFAVKLKITKYIVLVVMGPLFGALSEAMEAQITGQTAPFSIKKWISDAGRGLRSAIWLALFEWTAVLVLWVAGCIVPAIAPFTLFLAWLVGVWAYGASVMDYVWEREGLGAWSAWQASLRHAKLAFGVGLPFSLWMSVPLLAWTIGPLMGGMGAVAASVVALKGEPNRDDRIA